MPLSVLLLLSLCSFPFASSLSCYQSPDWNSTDLQVSDYCIGDHNGVPVMFTPTDCCVESDDSNGWKAETCLPQIGLGDLQESSGCFINETTGTTTCCCNKTLCNGNGSDTYKKALNRQHCHTGQLVTSCGAPAQSVNSKKRCNQDQFACYVAVVGGGNRQELELEIYYGCGNCEETSCNHAIGSDYVCCCKGNNCNNQILARSMRNEVCPTTTTTSTTTTTTTTVPTTTPLREPGTTEDSSGGLSGGIIALIVVASPLGLLVIVIGVAFIVKAIRQCINKQQEEI